MLHKDLSSVRFGYPAVVKAMAWSPPRPAPPHRNAFGCGVRHDLETQNYRKEYGQNCQHRELLPGADHSVGKVLEMLGGDPAKRSLAERIVAADRHGLRPLRQFAEFQAYSRVHSLLRSR